MLEKAYPFPGLGTRSMRETNYDIAQSYIGRVTRDCRADSDHQADLDIGKTE